MNPAEIVKLLGGYATGTLTEEERRELFEAALHNSELFAALADEEALKELLDAPGARVRLLEALAVEPTPASWFSTWLRRPRIWALAGSIAVAVFAILLVRQQPRYVEQARVLHEAAPTPPAAMDQLSKPAPQMAPKQQPAARREDRAMLERDQPARRKAAAPAGTPTLLEKAPEAKDKEESAKVLERQEPAAPAVAATPPPPPPPGPPVQAAGQAETAHSVAATPPVQAEQNQVLADKAVAKQKTQAVGGSQSPMGGLQRMRSSRGAVSSLVSTEGLRYTIQRLANSGNFVDAPPQTVFSIGDTVRIHLRPGQDANVYVFESDGTRGWKPVPFPAEMKAGVSYFIPPAGLPMTTAGEKRYRLLVSTQPLNAPDPMNPGSIEISLKVR